LALAALALVVFGAYDSYPSANIIEHFNAPGVRFMGVNIHQKFPRNFSKAIKFEVSKCKFPSILISK